MFNILFYVEPFPLRENHQAFLWVADLFTQMVRQNELHGSVFKNNGVATKIYIPVAIKDITNNYPGIHKLNYFLNATPDSQTTKLFKTYSILDWETEGIEEWSNLIRGEGVVTEDYFKALIEIHQQFQFDMIIYWGNNGAVRKFSRIFSIPAIAMELGCARKPVYDTLYFDYKGVNGYSALAQNKIQSNALYAMPPMEGGSKCYWDQALYPSMLPDTKKRKVLIPLQLSDDSNIIVFSKFRTMVEFVETVYDYFKPLSPHFIIKQHPGAKNLRWCQADQLKCQKFFSKLDNVTWIDSFDNNLHYLALLQNIDCIATINSSVGFEAMLMGRPTLTFGDSCYKSISCQTIDDIGNFFEAPDAGRISIQHNALAILYHYLANRSSVIQNPDMFLYQISRQVDLFGLDKVDSSGVISHMLASCSYFSGQYLYGLNSLNFVGQSA